MFLWCIMNDKYWRHSWLWSTAAFWRAQMQSGKKTSLCFYLTVSNFSCIMDRQLEVSGGAEKAMNAIHMQSVRSPPCRCHITLPEKKKESGKKKKRRPSAFNLSLFTSPQSKRHNQPRPQQEAQSAGEWGDGEKHTHTHIYHRSSPLVLKLSVCMY